MNLALIKITVQIMMGITMVFTLFMKPVTIDWFKYFVIPFPIGGIVFILLGILLTLTFFNR